MDSDPIVTDNVVIEDYSPSGPMQFHRGFSNAVFRRATLRGPVFSRTSLLGLISHRMELSDNRFEKTDFGSLIARKVHFGNCLFDSCIFGDNTYRARFVNCSLRNCNFMHTKFMHIDFYNCSFEHCFFEQCKFSDCQWKDGSVRNVRIQGTMKDCDFFLQSAQNVDLAGIQFKEYAFLDIKSGHALRFPFKDNQFFVRASDEPKILDSLRDLSSASRVRIGNTLSRYLTSGVNWIDVAAFEGLPAPDVEAVMAAARKFAVKEYPFTTAESSVIRKS